jgi:hypothetical protein
LLKLVDIWGTFLFQIIGRNQSSLLRTLIHWRACERSLRNFVFFRFIFFDFSRWLRIKRELTL